MDNSSVCAKYAKFDIRKGIDILFCISVIYIQFLSTRCSKSFVRIVSGKTTTLLSASACIDVLHSFFRFLEEASSEVFLCKKLKFVRFLQATFPYVFLILNNQSIPIGSIECFLVVILEKEEVIIIILHLRIGYTPIRRKTYHSYLKL